MIKTYDEALKTLNDIRTYLAISRADDCVQELDKVARYFINEKHKENPTFSECIKEWEDRGWKQFKGCFSILNFEKGKDVISFKLAPIEYYCWSTEEDGYSVFINSDLNNLITKTLKALEEMKDE